MLTLAHTIWLDETAAKQDVNVLVVGGGEFKGRKECEHLIAEFGVAHDAADGAGVLSVEDDYAVSFGLVVAAW